MSAFDDLLRGSPDVGTRDTPPVDNSAPTEVTVTGPPRTNYNNSKSVQAVQTALADPEAQGGGGVPGAWGLLPKQASHGTLRNILGLIGDSFLMGSGGRPEYQEAVQRQALGNAMAGFQKDPGTAASRIAALGVPDSADTAMKMFDQSENMKLRQQVQQQNNDYHKSMTQSRGDSALQRMTPYIGATVANISDPAEYKAAYARADMMAKRIDPEADPTTAFGLPAPEDWQPGMTSTAGATTGQVLRTDTSKASIAQRANAANVAHQDRLRGQDINARKGSSSHQPTSASMMSGLMTKQNSGKTLTPAEQAFWDHNTKTKASGGRTLPAGLTVKGGAGGGGKSYQGSPVFDNPNDSSFKSLPKGAKFYVQGDTTPRYKK